MNLVPDIEVNLLEENQDLLNTRVYAKLLHETVCATSNNGINIGLVGDWGTGKSSIIKTLLEELKKTNPSFGVALYDAWKFSNDSFRRMFLITLKKELGLQETNHFKSFYETQAEDIEVQQMPVWGWISIWLTVFGLLFYFVPAAYRNYLITFSSSATVVAALGFVFNIVSKSVSDLKKSVSRPYLFAAEQFEDCYKSLISQCLDNNQAENKWFETTPKKDKLIIIIDNLDRCHKEMAYELLTVLKTFLSNQDRVIFIIPFDENGLQKHFSTNENEGNSEAGEFLRKLFNVVIRIKPLKRFDLYEFTQTLNKKYSLCLKPDTVDMISKQYASNPRRVIQFCNNLNAELKTLSIRFDTDFSSRHQSAICKALIIREEWPALYKEICHNTDLFTKSNGFSEKNNIEFNDAAAFLYSTEVVGREIDYTILDKILSAAETGLRIDIRTEKAIYQHDIGYLVEKFETDEMRATLIDKAIELLSIEVIRQTWGTGVSNIFEFFCLYNQRSELPVTDNDRIMAEVSGNIRNIIFNINNPRALCNYAATLAKQNRPYLLKQIIFKIKVVLSDKDQKSTYVSARELLAFILPYCNNQDAIECGEIYQIDKLKNNAKIEDYTQLSEQGIDKLFSEDYFSAVINKLESRLEIESVLSDANKLAERKRLPESVYNILFSKAAESIEKNSVLKLVELELLVVLLENAPVFVDDVSLASMEKIINAITYKTNLVDALKNSDTNSVIVQVFLWVSLKSNELVNISNYVDIIQKFQYDINLVSPLGLFSVLIFNKTNEINNTLSSFIWNCEINWIWPNAAPSFTFLFSQNEFIENNLLQPSAESKLKDLFTLFLLKITDSNKEWLSFFQKIASNRLTEKIFRLVLMSTGKKDRPLIPLLLLPGISTVEFSGIENIGENGIGTIKKIALKNEAQYNNLVSTVIDAYLSVGFYEEAIELLSCFDNVTSTFLSRFKLKLPIFDDEGLESKSKKVIESLERILQNNEADPLRLIVKKAIYGFLSSGIDSTLIVQQSIKENRLKVKLTNEFAGGDPDPDLPKSMTIIYTYNGWEYKADFFEGGLIDLP